MKIPHELSVAVRVCYHGRIHHKIASEALEVDGRSAIHLFDLPPGYTAEHEAHQVDYVFRTKCLVPDSSGECAWRAEEIVDLDGFAGAESVTE